MLDWLEAALHQDVRVEPAVLLLRLGAAFVLGGVAAGMYRLTTRSRNGLAFEGTLVMLSVLIAILTLVIGNSVARAFSLVGALAIVRFRTVVEDTRDTAFVIYAVACGMACGMGFLAAPLAGTPLVLLAAWLFRPGATQTGEGEQLLQIRLATARAVEEQVQAVLSQRSAKCRLVSLATARGGAALDVTYLIRALPSKEALAMVLELNRIEGVQEVELKGG